MTDDEPPFFNPAEDCPERTPREILCRHRFTPLPPAKLSDLQLPGRLWELLYAAAARGFFFCETNHLADRELYTLLWNQWLDHFTVEYPPESGITSHLSFSRFKADGAKRREGPGGFRADEQNLEPLRNHHRDVGSSSYQGPPYDRDRHLPRRQFPLEAHSDWLPGDDDLVENSDADEPDPLGLAAVDREIAAARAETTFADLPPLASPDPAFESQLRACEPEHWTPPAEQLAAKNIPLLPPAEITDETLTPILWELLHNLSLQGFYVSHTDHLTDRALYAELWERGLRDPAHLPGRNPRGGWFHDLLGSWGDEQMQLWLRYYATDEERAKHAKDYPKDRIPTKEKPVSNRDWRLPKGPF